MRLSVILALVAALLLLLATFGVGNDDFSVAYLGLASLALACAAHFAGDKRVGT